MIVICSIHNDDKYLVFAQMMLAGFVTHLSLLLLHILGTREEGLSLDLELLGLCLFAGMQINKLKLVSLFAPLFSCSIKLSATLVDGTFFSLPKKMGVKG
jgi:hypothetical protein